jgi:hypothetical protein
VREHVRSYMRTAFELNTKVAEHREQTRPTVAIATPDVESDWNPAALALRARRGMSTDEPVRVRRHDGTAYTGRIVRLSEAAPARNASTLVIELDGGEFVHLADVASIAPAKPRAQRRDRRDPRLAACAHAFGCRGHCLTKSRRYSTSFKQLRADREGLRARTDPCPLTRRDTARARRGGCRGADRDLHMRRDRTRNSCRRAVGRIGGCEGA